MKKETQDIYRSPNVVSTTWNITLLDRDQKL